MKGLVVEIPHHAYNVVIDRIAVVGWNDLSDVEILVVDNKGDKKLENWINSWMHGKVIYIFVNDNNF